MQLIRRFFAHDAAGGILLIVAAIVALLLANSGLADAYRAFFAIEVEVRIAEFQVLKPLVLWINDGLMAIFFFTVGLELKREVLEGELSTPSQVALPAFAALGGMIVPALVYAWFNRGDAVAMRGWAIPTATDIAFALGVLLLLGKSVPGSLKLFLVTMAIVDDVGAIVIIALFYTADLAPVSLALAAACLVALFALNRFKVETTAPYLLIGMLMWLAVLKSGVHATLAGVLLAMFIPLTTRSGASPLRQLEHGLHSTVAFAVLPLFALANCGVTLAMGSEALLAPVPLGVAVGLVAGKPIGVLAFSGLAIALGLARMPARSNLPMFIGVSFLTGIGFTMSLFIGSLAFEHADPEYAVDERIGILLGSTVSALAGVALIRLGLKRKVPAR
jgi:NhaA family Na+:H+ antiporter